MCGVESWVNNRFNKFQKYDLQSGTWSGINTLNINVKDARIAFASVSEHLYCLVDLQLYKYDTTSQTWLDFYTQSLTTTSVPSRRFGHGAAALDKVMYIFGGLLTSSGSDRVVSDKFWAWSHFSRKWFQPVQLGTIPPACAYPYLFSAFSNLYLLWGAQSNTFYGWDQTSSVNPYLYKWVPATGVWSTVTMLGSPPPANQLYSSAVNVNINILLAVSRKEKKVYILQLDSMTWSACSDFIGFATIFDNSYPGIVALSAVSVSSSFVLAVLAADSREFLYLFDPASNSMKLLSESTTGTSLPEFPTLYSTYSYYEMFYASGKVYFFDSNPNNIILPNSVETTFLSSYDLTTNLWTENFRSSVIGLIPPSNRWFQTIILIESFAYAFGGQACCINDGTGYGNCGCNDIYVLPYPAAVEWPKYRSDWLNLFDWDNLRPKSHQNYSFQENLFLCSSDLPCFVGVRGDDKNRARLTRSGESGLVCVGADGCIGISLENVIIECDGEISKSNVLQFDLSSGFVSNSSFIKCSTESDGGAMQIRDNSNVTILNTLFQGCSSAKSGGAVSVLGSTCLIYGSKFVNCSALQNGGAFSAKPFVCNPVTLYPAVTIANSVFENSRSVAGSGGCASIESASSDLSDSYFYLCDSESNGGGIFVSEGSMNLSSILFMSCATRSAGGAFSCQKSTVSMRRSRFANNTALLGGGGAHVQDSASTFSAVFGVQNTAVTKGGGMILWTGIEPRFTCGAGFWGNFPQCIACEAGKFGAIESSFNLCSGCQPGQYSTGLGEILSQYGTG